MFRLLCNASDTLRPYMCHKVSQAPFSLHEHHGNFAVRSGNRTPSVRESNLHCIHKNAPSYERYRCNINHLGSIEGLAYHSELVCTHRELWSATVLPPSSHEGGRDENASAARVRRGGVHQHNCATTWTTSRRLAARCLWRACPESWRLRPG